jgi:hypothetical protein
VNSARTAIFFLTVAGVLAAEPPPDPADLLRRSIAAERVNRDRAFNYVWQEQIVHLQFDTPQGPPARNSSTYEVIYLEGESYHRLIARNGRPLAADEDAAERRRMEEVAEFRRNTPIEERRKRFITAEGRRLTFTYRLLTEHHALKIIGEETVKERKAWILEATPQHAPKPRNRKEWAFVLQSRIWIDQQTLLPLRMQHTQTKDWDNIPAGSVTEVWFSAIDDVWLVSRILARQETLRDGVAQVRQTEQTYSNYHKFAADSIIRFQDPELQ